MQTIMHVPALLPRCCALWMSLALLGVSASACGDDAPDIPHAISTESAASCKACHGHGIDNAPARHDEDDGCVDCHAPTSRTTAPAVPHDVTDAADGSCLTCHGAGNQGAPVTDHARWPSCVACHRSAD